MNWGNKIVLAFVLFAAFIGYLVYGAFQEDFDLVTDDYYAQELNYQQKINKLNNATKSGQVIKVSQQGDFISLQYPKAQLSGDIHFYHPSTKAYDRTFNIAPQDGKQLIPRDQFVAGHYRVHVSWEIGDTPYLQSSKLTIQ